VLFLCWAVAALVVWAVRDQEVGRGEGGREAGVRRGGWRGSLMSYIRGRVGVLLFSIVNGFCFFCLCLVL